MALHLGQQGRLAIGGKPGQFALVAIDPPAKRLGHKAVGEAKAARGMGPAEPAVVAIEIGRACRPGTGNGCSRLGRRCRRPCKAALLPNR